MKLKYNNAQYRKNPSAEVWHQDRTKNQVIFCLTLGHSIESTDQKSTEYIHPLLADQYFNVITSDPARSKIEYKSHISEGDLVGVTEEIPFYRVAIFRGCDSPKSLSKDHFYHEIPSLIHRSPHQQKGRAILLFRYEGIDALN